MNTFFSPLDKGSCSYFLIITMIFFVMLILSLGTEVLYIIQHFKDLTYKHVVSSIILLFNIFMAYFVNRLLYSMCSKSLD
jgi:hypothetical protein